MLGATRECLFQAQPIPHRSHNLLVDDIAAAARVHNKEAIGLSRWLWYVEHAEHAEPAERAATRASCARSDGARLRVALPIDGLHASRDARR